MTHQLAQQLKDAGFPQGNINSWHEETKGAYYAPTLEDLIISINEPFKSFRSLRQVDEWNFVAKDKDGFEGYGKSYYEALANLWLKMNKPVLNPIEKTNAI